LGPANVLVSIGSSNFSVVCSQPVIVRHPRCGGAIKGICEEDRKLIAAEKTRTQLGRQHSPITARADKKMQPAHGQMRIGTLEMHGNTYRFHYSWLEVIP
jgi:hypothetical protein